MRVASNYVIAWHQYDRTAQSAQWLHRVDKIILIPVPRGRRTVIVSKVSLGPLSFQFLIIQQEQSGWGRTVSYHWSCGRLFRSQENRRRQEFKNQTNFYKTFFLRSKELFPLSWQSEWEQVFCNMYQFILNSNEWSGRSWDTENQFWIEPGREMVLVTVDK